MYKHGESPLLIPLLRNVDVTIHLFLNVFIVQTNGYTQMTVIGADTHSSY